MSQLVWATVTVSVSIVAAAYFLGAFNRISWKARKLDKSVTVAVRKYQGPYKDVGKPMRDACSELHELDIQAGPTIGIYLDDPKTKPASECRSFVGCIIASPPPYPEAFPYTVLTLPATAPILATTFPFFSSLKMLSIILAVLRVYPSLTKFVEENKVDMGPVTEVYDGKHRVIEFWVFVGKEEAQAIVDSWG